MKKFNIKKFKSGFVKDTPDERDWKFEEIFGAITPSAEQLPDTFSWKNKMPKSLPSQLNIPSCVSCSFAFLEAFKQIKDLKRDDYRLSWRYIWANTPHTNQGSSFRDNAKTLQDKGTSVYALCEDRPEMGNAWVENPSNIIAEAISNALNNRIKNYQYVSWQDIKRAIYREPLIIAVRGNNQLWSADAVKNNNVIDEKGINDSNRQWQHAIVCTGYRKDDTAIGGIQLEFSNWWGSWGDNGYAWLKNPDLTSAISIEDLPNNNTLFMKFVKTISSPAVYLVNDLTMSAKAVLSGNDYLAMTDDPEFKQVKVVDQVELNKYKIVGKICSCLRP